MKHIKLYEDFINESKSSKEVKKVITQVFKKLGVKPITSNTTGVRGFSRNEPGKGYKHEYKGLVSLQGFSQEDADKLFTTLKDAGVKLSFPQRTGFGYDYED